MSGRHGRADAHIHLFREGFTDSDRDEVAWYEELRDDAGVSAALVVGYEGAARFRGNNAHILGLSRRFDWVRPVAYVDVSSPPPADDLRDRRSAGFVGSSAYLTDTGRSLSDWSADQLAALGGGILSINASPGALFRAADTLARIEDAVVLVSHLGLPGAASRHADRKEARELLAPLLALASHEHVSVKLSGLYAIDPRYPHEGARGAVEAVLQAFGAGRVAWGSDFSPVTAEVDASDAMVAPEWILEGLSATETDAILGGTLLRHLAHVDSIGGTDA